MSCNLHKISVQAKCEGKLRLQHQKILGMQHMTVKHFTERNINKGDNKVEHVNQTLLQFLSNTMLRSVRTII